MEPVGAVSVAFMRAYRMRETPSMKLSLFAPVAVICCALALAACANTVRGVGKDVKATANAVEDTVNN
nr:entericidin [Mesorhizobium sp. Root552]